MPKEGYTVVIEIPMKNWRNAKMITFLNSRQVDGLIITPAEGSKELTLKLIERNRPWF